MKAMNKKRVVMMVVDGLRADMVRKEYVPHLAQVATQSRVFTAHRSVFPSATRVNSASIATGCYPARHGLAGNAIALDEGEGLVAVSVGPAQFRERWRRATGHTLLVPTLSELLREHGGVVIHSNSSAGAAHMQDPDGHGTLYHRDGSHRPGFEAVTGDAHPQVAYDAGGDREITRRFCDALLNDPANAMNLLWICEPDHSQHALELGSEEHLDILAGADRCVQQVCESVQLLRERGEEVLFILCSDHGHETIDAIVPVTQLLVDAGLKQSATSNDVVLASSGMSALLYFSPEAMPRRDAIAQWLLDADWCHEVFIDTATATIVPATANACCASLSDIGLPTNTALQIAFAMGKRNIPNRFGVRGTGGVVADPFMQADTKGLGQHGGLGPYETNPMLLVSGPGIFAARTAAPSCAVDIAPTVLQFLARPVQAMDGQPLKLW
jgi:arylsulfatase A-like enzyme